MTRERGNGLGAGSFTPLLDVAPDQADVLLEALREQGIAAYAAPLPAPPEPVRGRPDELSTAPDRSAVGLHRVYVDSAAVLAARRLVAERLPDLGAGVPGSSDEPVPTPAGSVEDAAWEQIVAAYDEPVRDPVPRWPAREDLVSPAGGQPPPATGSGERGDRVDGGYGDWGDLADGTDARVAADGPADPKDVEDPDDHFVPPPPPPLPATDPLTKLGWVGLLGGPLALLLSALFGLGLDGWLGLLAVMSFVGGFVMLVARMKDRPPDDADPDAGAVV
jgi:hypothetical protein